MSFATHTRVLFSLTFVLVVLSQKTEISAQSVPASAAHPEFESVSVKPGDAIRSGATSVAPGGRFSAIDTSLQQLLRFAFDMQDFQISGGPNWMDSTKFTIEATAPRSA